MERCELLPASNYRSLHQIVRVDILKIPPTASRTAELFVSGWIQTHGAPRAVLTDNGAAFTGNDFRTCVTQELQAVHFRSSPYYPQGNGVNEASHKGLSKTLQSLHRVPRMTLLEAVMAAQLIHNATPHPAVGMSPYCAMYGLNPYCQAGKSSGRTHRSPPRPIGDGKRNGCACWNNSKKNRGC
eukprot:Blabericola_migrator_1__1927@NODE_1523_length_4348_cov_17_645176_g557_i4_p2_GENE_NODE_1523_length_4348_cov_17_645176_g557_i4NODE_1523_length_4348_cov_17_645176_g557_i4_p2_ORF_typecomplete_len184_score6_51rve/PF00665_26/1_8e09DDE_2/PF02914_15/0_01_NODE_1523_length_4348_cov_17_645176_g557_i434133964